MEISNKESVNVNVEMMPFKKYVQSKKILCNEGTIKICGTFREKKSGKIIENDIFNAHKLGKKSLEEIYGIYLSWFNYTRTEDEEEREFVSVKSAEAETTD